MPLSTTVSILQGITAVTPTGGAAVSFKNDGQGTNGRKVLVDSSNGDPNTRKKLITSVVVGFPGTAKNPQPKLHRATVDFHQPMIDTNGLKANLPANFTVTYHPDMTAAQRTAHFMNILAVLIDSELADMLTNVIND